MANTCIVSGNIKDATNTDVADATIEAIPIITDIIDKENIIIPKNAISTTSDSNGDFSLTLIRSVEYQGTGSYTFTIKPTAGGNFKFASLLVPDSATADFEDLIAG